MTAYPFIIIGLVLVAFALPALILEKSVKRFAIGLVVSLFGVVLARPTMIRAHHLFSKPSVDAS